MLSCVPQTLLAFGMLEITLPEAEDHPVTLYSPPGPNTRTFVYCKSQQQTPLFSESRSPRRGRQCRVVKVEQSLDAVAQTQAAFKTDLAGLNGES